MTRYGRSPWVERFPKSRVPAYPRHRGPAAVDVVIVGGGLTGCATAYALAAAGVKPILLEADRLARSRTAAALGWIGDDPGVGFADAERALGVRRARAAFQAWRRAALDFTTLVRRLNVRCGLEPAGRLTVARTPDDAARMRREQKSRKNGGLEAPLLTARAASQEAGLDALLAMRGQAGATVDPYRLALGLASAAVHRGAALFEQSPVTRITFTRKDAEVHTADGSIRTKRVIVATGAPAVLFASLARHFWFRTRFMALTDAIPARIRRQLGPATAVLHDCASPPHVVRWLDDERMLVAGADAPVVADRQREKVVVQRTGQLMYELSVMYPDISGIPPVYGWDLAYAKTAEGLPYIGPHRNFPHHLFAFGDSSHSVTGAFLASRIFVRYVTGQPDPSDQAFEFTR